MTNVRIYVTYRESVFDPQGDTIKQAIHALGHDEVADVKVGKFFDVEIFQNRTGIYSKLPPSSPHKSPD